MLLLAPLVGSTLAGRGVGAVPCSTGCATAWTRCRDGVTVFEAQTRADLLLLRGHVRASRAVHERTIALSDALRMPGYRSQQRWAATVHAQWAGDLEDAERLADRALQVHQQTGVQFAAVAKPSPCCHCAGCRAVRPRSTSSTWS